MTAKRFTLDIIGASQAEIDNLTCDIEDLMEMLRSLGVDAVLVIDTLEVEEDG